MSPEIIAIIVIALLLIFAALLRDYKHERLRRNLKHHPVHKLADLKANWPRRDE